MPEDESRMAEVVIPRVGPWPTIELNDVTIAEIEEFQRTCGYESGPMPLDLRMSGEIRGLIGIARAYKARVWRYEAVTLLRVMGVPFDKNDADQPDSLGPESTVRPPPGE